GRSLTETDHPCYSHLIRWQNTAWALRLLQPDICQTFDLEGAFEQISGHLPPGWPRWEGTARAQAIEAVSFLSAYLLSSQGDRVAMAHGVEVRYPFLDPDVVDYCARLPPRLKLLGLQDKPVLRRIGVSLLPTQISLRAKKPYRAPVTAVLHGAINNH